MIGFKLDVIEKNFQGDDAQEKERVTAADFVDRLHSRTTVFILAFFASIVGIQFFGKPIDCITPKDIDAIKGWNDYVMDYCLVRGTYRYRGQHFDSTDSTIREEDYIPYYQWIPLLFIFQMVCFLIPQLFWTIFQSWFYIDLETIVSETNGIRTKSDAREEKENKIAEYIFQYFYHRRAIKKSIYSMFWRYPNIITSFYFIVKLLNFVNVLGQLFLVCHMLDADIFWGFAEAMFYLETNTTSMPPTHRGLTTSQSKYFPTETRCVFSTSHLRWFQNMHNSQCLLTLNWINGKLFLILYFWYFFLAAVTMGNISSYVYSWLNNGRLNEVASCVLKSQNDSLTRSRLQPYVSKFVKFLGHDGCLILQFIRELTNTSVYYDVACKIWEKYDRANGISNHCLRENECSYSVGNTYSVRAPFASGDSRTAK